MVSTQAVLSLAAVKHSEPVQCNARGRFLSDTIGRLSSNTCREPAHVEDSESKSAADRLIGLALDTGLEPFHDQDQQGSASVRVSGIGTTIRFGRAISRFFYYERITATRQEPGGRAICAAQELLEARALFDAPESRASCGWPTTVANLYLDLCDRSWRAVQIDSERWLFVDKPEPKFRRSPGSQSLPAPERGWYRAKKLSSFALSK